MPQSPPQSRNAVRRRHRHYETDVADVARLVVPLHAIGRGTSYKTTSAHAISPSSVSTPPAIPNSQIHQSDTMADGRGRRGGCFRSHIRLQGRRRYSAGYCGSRPFFTRSLHTERSKCHGHCKDRSSNRCGLYYRHRWMAIGPEPQATCVKTCKNRHLSVQIPCRHDWKGGFLHACHHLSSMTRPLLAQNNIKRRIPQ